MYPELQVQPDDVQVLFAGHRLAPPGHTTVKFAAPHPQADGGAHKPIPVAIRIGMTGTPAGLIRSVTGADRLCSR